MNLYAENISSTIHQDTSRYIKIHQDTSRYIKIHQDTSYSSNSFNKLRKINCAENISSRPVSFAVWYKLWTSFSPTTTPLKCRLISCMLFFFFLQIPLTVFILIVILYMFYVYLYIFIYICFNIYFTFREIILFFLQISYLNVFILNVIYVLRILKYFYIHTL
ncbi:hypothetical protein PUN28_009519 [Cardiocondyla obscurior]|uniref:Uncharacterized protein n=1 Tax=Cardiocondyla obscurior TaxID=286306 RepID=A0AAW2FUX4_9HYME